MKTNINELNAIKQQQQTCPASAYQPCTVCVPVTYTPYANPGPITVSCNGDSIVTPGSNTCAGTENGSCSFTITQNLGVLVPVEFGCTTSVGNPFVQCGQLTNDDNCNDCD